MICLVLTIMGASVILTLSDICGKIERRISWSTFDLDTVSLD